MENQILAICLPQQGALPSSAFEVLSAAKTLASQSQGKVFASVISDKAQALAQNLNVPGIEKIFALEHPKLGQNNDEIYAQAILKILEGNKFSAILFPGTIFGKSLAALLSPKIKAGLAVDITEVGMENGKIKAKRSSYSGNALATLTGTQETTLLIALPMVFPQAEKSGNPPQIVSIPFEPKESQMEYVSFQPEASSEIDLGTAERIVSGGRGLGNAEGFKIIRELANALKAAVGASRAAVDAGWIAYSHQVGLTGKTVHPKLYVACGISGQIQHLAGMSSSGTIVALNTDPECPMMKTASLSVTGDLYELIPLIIAEIKKRRGG